MKMVLGTCGFPPIKLSTLRSPESNNDDPMSTGNSMAHFACRDKEKVSNKVFFDSAMERIPTVDRQTHFSRKAKLISELETGVDSSRPHSPIKLSTDYIDRLVKPIAGANKSTSNMYIICI